MEIFYFFVGGGFGSVVTGVGVGRAGGQRGEARGSERGPGGCEKGARESEEASWNHCKDWRKIEISVCRACSLPVNMQHDVAT